MESAGGVGAAEGCTPSKRQMTEKDQVEMLLAALVKKHEDGLEKMKHDGSLLIVEVKGEGRQDTRKEVTRGEASGEGVEGQDYFTQLLPEVFDMVLAKLNPMDVYNLSQTCTTMKEQLEPKKIDTLFPLVVPHILKYLNQQNYMKCRAVSKSWKALLDDILKNAIYAGRRGTGPNLMEGTSLEEKGYCVKLIDSKVLDKFLDDMKNNKFKNPFIGKRLLIGVGDASNAKDSRFWDGIWQVLDKLGDEIWACAMFFYCGSVATVNVGEERFIKFFRRVPQVVMRLPKLLELTIVNVDPVGNLPYFDDAMVTNIRQTLEKVEPFPAQRHHIKVHFVNLKTHRFFPLLPVEYWKYLEKLELTEGEFDKTCRAFGDNLPFTSLKSIEIIYPDGRKNFSKLKLIKSPLVDLQIKMITPREHDLVDVMPVISHFGETLQIVGLHWSCEYNDLVPETPLLSPGYLQSCLQLSAPYVKVLLLTNFVHSFNFLVCFQSLQLLALGHDFLIDPYVSERKDEIIEIYGFTGKMYSSNLWAKLPCLKGFILKGFEAEDVHEYTRKDFEDFIKTSGM